MIKLFNLPDATISDSDKTLFSTLTFNYSFITVESTGGGGSGSSSSGFLIHIGTPTLSVPIDGFPDYSQIIGQTIVEIDPISSYGRGVYRLTAVNEINKTNHVV